jgi:hypothetical protein
MGLRLRILLPHDAIELSKNKIKKRLAKMIGFSLLLISQASDVPQ